MRRKLAKLEMTNKLVDKKYDICIGFQMVQNRITTPNQLIRAARKNLYADSDVPQEQMPARILPGFLLTEREVEVAMLLLKGKSNSQIAELMYVSLSTVKKHIAKIFKKANVRSRSEFISRVKL